MAREANARRRAGNDAVRRSATSEGDAGRERRGSAASGGTDRRDDRERARGSRATGSRRPSREHREYRGRQGGDAGQTGEERAALPLYVRYRGRELRRRLRAACFWTAIVLPFLYVPLLVAGVETRAEGVALLALLALNAGALLAGHSYRD